MRHPTLCLVTVLLLVSTACRWPHRHPLEGQRASDETDRDAEERHPGAIAQRAQARRLADGTIPRGALVAAFAQRQRQQAFAPEAAGPTLTWNWLGPQNVGGRIRAALIHPTNPQRIWIGSAGGGVWRTDDGGTTWQPLNGLLPMLGCGCMALDPADPNHVLFGSGEGFFDAVEGSSNTAILRGAGLFESFDAGVTWSQVAATAVPEWDFVNRLCYHPQNPQVLLAATGSGIWRSADGGVTWSRRTLDRVLDIDFRPDGSNEAVAGRTNGVVLRSTDGGVTWATSASIAGGTRVELAYARSSPNLLYAAVSDTIDEIRIWLSGNGGVTFTPMSPSGIATYSLYNNLLWVDPTNSNNLLYGGVQLYVSTDGGVTRTQSTTGAHSDYHVAVEVPGFGPGNQRVYVTGDGGIYTRASWNTGTWSSRNQGLGITQFYGAAVQPSTGIVVAGAQDNGTSRYSGSAATWQRNVIGGDGGFCAADPANSSVFYAGFQRLGIYRSTNGGTSWSNIQGATTTDAGFNFIPYFTVDPNDGNRMWACGRALWRADDVRTGAPPTWVQAKAGRTCVVPRIPQAHFQDNAPCNHSAVAVAVGDSDLVWTAHNDGELYKSTNATAATPAWTLIDGAGGALPDRWINCIAIDPTDHDRVLVGVMGYAADNVWETRDGGASWQQRTGSGAGALPALPVSWVTMHPHTPSWLFVATDLGVWHSRDGGGSWQPVPGGPENVCVDQLVWRDDRTLLVVTHGQGAWELGLPAAVAQPFGSGCGSVTPPVLQSTAPILGLDAVLSLTSSRPAAPVLLSYSAGPGQGLPLGPCTVEVDLASAVSLFAGATDGTGAWSLALPIPPQPQFLGVQLTLQTLALAVGGPALGLGDLSNAVDWVLGQ